METNDELRERIRRKQRLAARLRLATVRLEEAQRERIWTVVEAHESGLSIRQIAATMGLSSSRVHQLLGSEESREIPRWRSQRRDQEAAPSQGQPDLQAILAGEMNTLRRCREWLERLDRGEQVVVNLRLETDPDTEYVAFDRPAGPRHRRPGGTGRLSDDCRGGGQEGKRRSPARPSPPTVGGTRPATETTDYETTIWQTI
jgi:AraC-like DNA-binding protein